MKFDELDARMRVFETANDRCVLPGIFVVARIDGRNFTRLTKDLHQFHAPFDLRFSDMMATTTEHLMMCGFRMVYGYTQSDEISVLLHRDDQSFGRKTRKINSVLAGEASARFSLLLGGLAAFDCRVCELTTVAYVRDYFRWRSEDAHRNALNAHCYWMLRKAGRSVNEATDRILGLSVADKNELLFQGGVNFNDLPAWQKRGVGIYWENFEKDAVNRKTGETLKAVRRRLKRDLELPFGDEYGQFIVNLMSAEPSEIESPS
jgi:tRNA(His) guanylyltransferase